MYLRHIALSTLPVFALLPAHAHADEGDKPAAAAAASPSFNTGVARARDQLDSATSTSTIVETEISKIAPRSLAELLRNLPGIRAEAASGDGNNSYSVRGLPLAADGAKYIQFQENGLPVLELGDLLSVTADLFVRADLNLAGVQAIRGGSASTFASNAPGGIINLIDKTGEVEGGSLQLSSGLDYETYRGDFDYGAKLSDTLRFHIGGFYRAGEGARATGYTAFRGGQLKFNITKDFGGGDYIRVYAKWLEDKTPQYGSTPIRVGGSAAQPEFSDLANFSATHDTLLSRNTRYLPGVDRDRRVTRNDLHDSTSVKARSIGFEARFEVADIIVVDKFRYADMSGRVAYLTPLATLPAAVAAAQFGGPGATLRYASGPNAGQAITNPAAINGNGLLALSANTFFPVRAVDNITNDIRGSRVWAMAGGELTMTGGFYKSRQTVAYGANFASALQDIVGGGQSSLVDITAANGTPITQGGVLLFGVPAVGYRRDGRFIYNTNAPYSSFNFHRGAVSVGGSIRYDTGKATGVARKDSAIDTTFVDLDGNGVPSSFAETQVTLLPLQFLPVNVRYNYVSYSVSANYRVSEIFSTFARYSRGARVIGAQTFSSDALDPVTGKLLNKDNAYDPVRQLEGGIKYRNGGVSLNITGFLANVSETNAQLNTDSNGSVRLENVSRSYRAYGAEFEAGLRSGPFRIDAGATVTKAEITKDALHPEFVGNRPRHQAGLIYQVTPQYDAGRFAVGANVIGTTSSYSQDLNKLKMPAYTTVGAFATFAPVKNVILSLNGSNLFDVRAITDIGEGDLPADRIVHVKTLLPRTVSASVRLNF